MTTFVIAGQVGDVDAEAVGRSVEYLRHGIEADPLGAAGAALDKIAAPPDPARAFREA